MQSTEHCLTSALLIVSLLLGGCAAPQALRRGEQEAQRGNWDAAVAYYRHLVEEFPNKIEYQMKLKRALAEASQQHEASGRRLWEAGQLEDALLEYELAVQLDPANQVATTDLRHLQEELAEAGAEPPQPTLLERIKEQAAAAAPPLPVLEPQVEELFSLDFRDVQIKDVYRTLARLAGLNVLFDPQLADQEVSIELDDVTFFEALDMLTRASGHFYKAFNNQSFLVIPDNPTKRRQYMDQVMRTFFLSNADAQTVAQTLRALLQARLVAENVDVNSVTIRDTPQVVEIAERIVTVADKSPGEVILEIEILEVSRRLMRDYGLSLSEYQVTQTLRQGEAGISVNRLRFINASDWFVTIPSIRYRLFKESGDFKLVADPQLRLSEGQQAELVIGEEVPIVTTTFSPQQLVGAQVVPIRSTQYRDVGIVIGATARVHHNREVTIDLEVEVSSVTGTSTIEDLPIFATRRLSSSIRLRDGESNILGGLLRDDERTSLRGVPGLTEVPVLKRLFGATQDDVQQTDVILTVTPHILRTADITADDLASVYVGTEANISGGIGQAGVGQAVPRPTPVPGAPAPTAQEAALLALLPADHVVTVEDEFALDVVVDGVTELFSAGLRLSFDPSIVQFVEAFEGSFMSMDGVETTFQASPAGAGDTAVGISRIGEVGGVSGSGTIATLVFRAVGEGQTRIEITTAAIRGPDGRALPVELQGADVEVVQRP